MKLLPFGLSLGAVGFGGLCYMEPGDFQEPSSGPGDMEDESGNIVFFEAGSL